MRVAGAAHLSVSTAAPTAASATGTTVSVAVSTPASTSTHSAQSTISASTSAIVAVVAKIRMEFAGATEAKFGRNNHSKEVPHSDLQERAPNQSSFKLNNKHKILQSVHTSTRMEHDGSCRRNSSRQIVPSEADKRSN